MQMALQLGDLKSLHLADRKQGLKKTVLRYNKHNHDKSPSKR